MEKSNMIPNVPIKNSDFPIGLVCMWTGDTKDIPRGWVLCDGRDHGIYKAPDLRSCFIVGAGEGEGYDNVNMAGEASTMSIGGAGTHAHSIPLYSSKAAINPSAGNTPLPSSTTDTVADHSHPLNIVNMRGKEKTNELKPKWYALYFIVYIGV